MILDKICFIHLRNRSAENYSQYDSNGGATIAWYVEGVSGDILVGRPVRCSEQDVFVKEQGRKLAVEKFQFENTLYVIPRARLVQLAVQQAENALMFKDLAPNARALLLDVAKENITSNIEGFMSSNWYEQIVRAHFILEADNTLYAAREVLSGDFQQYRG